MNPRSRAPKLSCSICGRSFYASRRDTKYCGERCRTRSRMEDAKFRTPRIPRSGIPGITFSRFKSNWVVRIREDDRMKYCGSFKTLDEAKRFHTELIGGI